MSLFASIDAAGWVIIIGAVFFGFQGLLTLRFQQRAIVLAEKTHTLVNSNMGIQLLLLKTSTARLAALPEATQQDKDEANQAAAAYADHTVKQDKVDAEESK